MRLPSRILPRVFVVNAALHGTVAGLLLFSPIRISAPITRPQALIIVVALALTLLVNAPLLRIALAPLKTLAREMEAVDLLRSGQRLPVASDDEVGRVVATFNHMLGRLESERRESVRRVVAAQESERAGIARDLHDEVGQVLTTLLLQLDSTQNAVPPDSSGEIDAAKQSVRRALDEVRRISSGLRPEMLDELGLVSALTELTRTFSRATGIRVRRQFDTAPPELEPETELAVYRIVQESLTNIARHSRAAAAAVSLERGADEVVVRVVDDGRGLGADPVEHGGLRGMRERALLIGAELAIEQTPSGGVEVRLEVPVAAIAHPAGAPR
jgi:two-component system sensor histidine kinase UhpB